MQVFFNDERKQIEIWLSREDQQREEIREELDEFYKRGKESGYMVIVFESGTRDAYEGTLDLLLHNKKCIAELEAKKQRQSTQRER